MTEAFAWYLLHWLRTKPNEREEPDKVRIATANFKKKNDVFKQFVDEYLEKDRDSHVSLNMLYNEFKDWFRDAIGHNILAPNKQEARNEFIVHLGPPVDTFQNRWVGYRIRSMVDIPPTGGAEVPPPVGATATTMTP